MLLYYSVSSSKSASFLRDIIERIAVVKIIVTNYFRKKKLKPAKICKEGFAYSSDKNKKFLSVSHIKKLIKKNILDEKI